MNIGNWIARFHGERRLTDWHLVDSTIEDRAVTRCGREMHRVTKGGELQVSEVMPLTRMIGQPQNCRYCDRPSANPVEVSGGLALEDDANTSPVDPT